jgi:RNA ligase (TIGR02306 family)
MRALATITKIKKIVPIEGADQIEAVMMTTNNWIVVSKKNELKVNDLCVYFEIDSFLPKEERYKFLDGKSNKTFNGVEGYRLRTIKLRKQVSQGLVLPISIFPEIANPSEGQDVTELLKISLYEIPQTLTTEFVSKRPARNFPNFIPKTDQTRIQSFRDYELDEMDKQHYEITEKLDGMSATYYFHQNHFGVCSRNLEILPNHQTRFERIWSWIMRKLFFKSNAKQQPENKLTAYEEIAQQKSFTETLPACCKKLNKSLAIQGEIVGPGISSNRLKLDAIEFYVFDVFDIDKHNYLDAAERQEIIKDLSLKSVPVVDENFYLDLSATPFDKLLEMAQGKSALSKELREGIVFKQRAESSKRHFKVISNEYLLKHGE